MAPQLLSTPPIYCSACWCAQPEKRHVDYQADNDQGYGNATDTQISYDNLQLCEDCMKAGATLVGMVDAAERDADMHRLMAENDRLTREARQAQNYADRLEDAFEHRAQPIELDHRQKPRGMSEENRREASERMKRLHEEGKMRRKEPVT